MGVQTCIRTPDDLLRVTLAPKGSQVVTAACDLITLAASLSFRQAGLRDLGLCVYALQRSSLL